MPRGAEAPVSLGFLLWHATLRWQRLLAAALRPLGLTHVQFVLLAVLWWLQTVVGERPSQRMLADQAGTDRMMTSQVVRALERRGLVKRHRDTGDSRALQLELTDEGARLAVEAIRVVEEADRRFFGPVAERGELLSALRALSGLDAIRPLPSPLQSSRG